MELDKIYSVNDLAERYHVKQSTIWAWIREGKLKALRINNRYYCTAEQLKDFENQATIS